MAPRPGGESDKFGNRYEGAWTVRHLLYVLNSDGQSLTLEPVGDLADGAEFAYVRNGSTEVHQVKRQHKNINSWSVKSLHDLGIWENARGHVDAGRHFHFVSTVPSRVLQELCDNARRSADLQSFVAHWLPNKPLRQAFTELSSPSVLGSPELAWSICRGVWIEWHDERDVIQVNAALAGLLLEGAPGVLAAAGLADLVSHNLGVVLTADKIVGHLATYGLSRAAPVRRTELTESVASITANWAASVESELLKPPIPRAEATELTRLVVDAEVDLLFVVGTAGGGKSAVLHQSLQQCHSAGLPTLAFRLDRLEPFSSTTELGNRLGLDVSPVAALAAIAGEQTSVLLLDQLDAVSLASGRMPNNFAAIADLIREAGAFPRLHLVLACRKFDLENDHRIRELSTRKGAETLIVSPLTDEQVDSAVNALGLDAMRINSVQRDLLRSPVHLVLLASLAPDENALDFRTSEQLFDAFWERKRREVSRRRPGTRFVPTLAALAQAISAQQRLSVPASVLDQNDLGDDADVLVSEHVLLRDGAQVAFFHESFFDYAFARQWVNRGESVLAFLTVGEQELFRRAQVRQLMTHLRGQDPSRFGIETGRLLLADDVRFHIKETLLRVVGGLADPTSTEAELLLGLAGNHPAYESRMWDALRTPAWFQRFDEDGCIAAWLEGSEEEQSRALSFMGRSVHQLPDRVADLLQTQRERPEYPDWLRWILRSAPLDASRPLFELFTHAVSSGLYSQHEREMWMATDGLASRPEWALELIAAMIAQPGSLDLNDRGQVSALTSRHHATGDLISACAQALPKEFLEVVLPYLLKVMESTSSKSDGVGLAEDRHFSRRHPGDEHDRSLDQALYQGAAEAIASLSTAGADEIRETLQLLADSPFDAAQWLLYQGLISAGAVFAEWAAEVLLQGQHRLLCGYVENSVWISRELLRAISERVTDDTFARLEGAVRDLRFPWETRNPGWYAFVLLSGLSEKRLSELGRRRLGELQRSTGFEQPPEPRGTEAGFIGPPIPPAAAARLRDEDWLRAIGKHREERTDWSTQTGGARELSSVLREQVKGDADRFARLAVRLTSEANPAYGDAFLMGLGEADPVGDEGLALAAVRHIASLGQPENDRWIGWSLRPYLKTAPLEMVELVRDRAVAAADPADDGWRFRSEDSQARGRRSDLVMSGMNTARGSLAETLGDLLIYDSDGSRTACVLPALPRLAGDPSIPVRASAAHALSAALRYARAEAVEAFWILVDADDVLLTAEPVQRLIIHVGNDDPAAVAPVIRRMLSSPETEARRAGGLLAAFAGLEWALPDLLASVVDGSDSSAREGAADLCAHRLPHTSNVVLAKSTLVTLVEDTDEDVRKACSELAGALRGHALRPHAEVLSALMQSPSFGESLAQLLITLEYAPDRVDDLALLCARRFIEVFGAEAGDMRTGAAADAHHVAEIVVRGLAQAEKPSERSDLLDVIDSLMMLGAYGIDQLVSQAER